MILEQLSQFADACNETTGASFTISRAKDGQWKVSFVNQSDSYGRTVCFSSISIEQAIADANHWLIKQRKPVEVETRYTLYTK